MKNPNPTRRPRRLLKATALVLLTLTAVAALTLWVMREKIVSMVLDIAESRLAEKGLYIHRGSHDLSWQHGVVLNQLDLYVDEGRTDRLAQFDHLGFRISLMEIFRRTPTLHIGAQDSGLTLKTTAGELRLDQVSFSMTSSPGSLTIGQMDLHLHDLRVTATGLLKWQADGSKKAVDLPDLSPLANAAKWLDFPRGEPTLALEINTRDTATSGIDLKGHLTGSNFSWRNLSFARADLTAELADDGVEIPSLDVDCYGGNIKADLTVNDATGKLMVNEVTSSVDPFRFVDAVMNRDSLKSFQSLGTTTMHGSGLVVDIADFSLSTGTLTAVSPGGISLDFDDRKVVMNDFRSGLQFTGGKLVVGDARFGILGGSGEGTYTMPLKGGFSYQLQIEGSGLSLERLASENGMDESLSGHVDATFQGGGASGMKSHFGSGRISVEDGDFYSVPLVGSLRDVLRLQSPKFVDIAHDLNCSYALRDGLVSTDDLLVESTATKLLAKGRIDLIQQTLDADVRANLRGLPGVATALVSEILTLHGEGPLDDVRWRTISVPAIARDVIDLPIDGVEAVGKGLTEVTVDGVKAVTKGVGKVIESVGDTAGELFDLRPGFLIPKPREESDE